MRVNEEARCVDVGLGDLESSSGFDGGIQKSFVGCEGLLSGEIDDVVDYKRRFVQGLLISLGFGKFSNNRDYFVFDQMSPCSF